MEDQNTTPGAKRGSRRSTASAGATANDAPEATSAGSTQGSPVSRQTGSTDDERSGGMMGRVRDRAAAGLTSQKDRATEGLGSVAQAVRQSTQQLRDQRHDTAAQYVEQAADQIERWTNRLRQKDVREIIDDAQRLARRQPAWFIGGAFALGLVGARFFKSSPPERGGGSYGYEGYNYRGQTPTGRSIGTITGPARDTAGTEMY